MDGGGGGGRMDEMECGGGRRQGIYFNFQSLRRKTSLRDFRVEKRESASCAFKLLKKRVAKTYTKVAKKLSSGPFFFSFEKYKPEWM